jgi:hypothetical protein
MRPPTEQTHQGPTLLLRGGGALLGSAGHEVREERESSYYYEQPVPAACSRLQPIDKVGSNTRTDAIHWVPLEAGHCVVPSFSGENCGIIRAARGL